MNETRIEENLRVIDRVQQEAGCKVLLAFKGFAMWNLAPLVRKYLPGTSASSVSEALLGHHEFGGELHVYSPAYNQTDIDTHLQLADHIVFNSPAQWNKYRALFVSNTRTKAGLRINPEHSEVSTAIYDPCAPFSRLGTTLTNFKAQIHLLEGISGLHVHNLCELNSDSLERTMEVVEKTSDSFSIKSAGLTLAAGITFRAAITMLITLFA